MGIIQEICMGCNAHLRGRKKSYVHELLWQRSLSSLQKIFYKSGCAYRKNIFKIYFSFSLSCSAKHRGSQWYGVSNDLFQFWEGRERWYIQRSNQIWNAGCSDS